MNRVVRRAKKSLMVGAVAIGLSGAGLMGGAGLAAAATGSFVDSGSYDELVEVHGDKGVLPIEESAIQAAQVSNSTEWKPNKVTGG
jgi:hypothetical protein